MSTAGPTSRARIAPVRVRSSTRADGDFAIGNQSVALDRRRQAFVDLPWVWLSQVHGSTVHTVTGDHLDAVRDRAGDALVTTEADLVLAVQTADCVPVVFEADNGAIGIAHAGWKGAEAGVIATTAVALRELGATALTARFGPCIGPCCYEFGATDLDRLAVTFGAAVVGRTDEGHPALDLPALVTAACTVAGVTVVGDRPPCTACDADRYFSHRARRETERLTTVVWRDGGAP